MTFESGQSQAPSQSRKSNAHRLASLRERHAAQPLDHRITLSELVNDDARVKLFVNLLNARNSACRVPCVAEYERREVDFEELVERRKKGAEKKEGEEGEEECRAG